MKSVWGPVVLSAALGLSACGVDSKQTSSDTKIVGGEEVSETQNDIRRWATVGITTDLQKPTTGESPMDNGKSFCTGTLISKTVIVTAAHCLQKFDPETQQKEEELILPNVSDFVVYFDTKVNPNGHYVRARAVIPHPKWSPKETLAPSPSSPPNDIGVIVLEEAAPDKAKPAKIGGNVNLSEGDSIYLAGYGVTKSRNNNDTGILRQVRTDYGKIDRPAKRFSVGKYGYGACAGDSGGPAYAKVNGVYEVIGATSTGAEIFGQCLGILNNYTDVRPYKSWIASVSR
jgi:secreted trypsin-like serine protease